MVESLTVERLQGDRYVVAVRGHEVIVDQPAAVSGSEAGPTPTELFVGALASCVAFYAGRALRGVAGAADLRVRCSWRMSDTPPWRVTDVAIVVETPPDVSPERMAAVGRAVTHCTVHNSLEQPPDVSVAVIPRLSAGTVVGPR